MSATELERQLAAVLRQQADEVIADADTQARRHDLMRELEGESSRHHSPRQAPSRSSRRLWTVGVAAAAAAAAILAVSVPTLLPSQTEDRESVAPAPDASALRVAGGFFEAFASFDRERAASLLADDAEVHLWSTRTGEDAWRRGNRYFEAIGGQVILHSCQVTGASSLGTLVECAFAWHALHSERLGHGPFSGGLFMFTIDDGEIVWMRQSASSDDFDVELWRPFAEWVREAHPEAAKEMYADWPTQDWESLTPRSIELWEELSREWLREQRR